MTQDDTYIQELQQGLGRCREALLAWQALAREVLQNIPQEHVDDINKRRDTLIATTQDEFVLSVIHARLTSALENIPKS